MGRVMFMYCCVTTMLFSGWLAHTLYPTVNVLIQSQDFKFNLVTAFELLGLVC